MGLTGKYNFSGLKKLSVDGVDAALASVGWFAWVIKLGLKPFFDGLLGMFINEMANDGLIVLNIGAIYVNGEIDQARFDKAMDDGWTKVQQFKSTLTPDQGKAIDDAVKNAARKFIPFSSN